MTALKPWDEPPPKPKGPKLKPRPVKPKHAGAAPSCTDQDLRKRDRMHRVPAGGGYRVLRRPQLLDSDG